MNQLMTKYNNKVLPDSLPQIGFLYMDHVLRFFDVSNFKGWPNKIESVVYHWTYDKQSFINEVKHKKIDVLIGNIPATAYETFREIANALPQVQFIPSLDSQFANKSKENVTHLCKKYNIAIPKTEIFYNTAQADNFLKRTNYPKIIKKSYGPSNYGGYFVHKVNSYNEASSLLQEKQYCPIYVQNFIEMSADIRVMLIGHRPVCAFWRRAAKGDWLTNTSQGGTMDYQGVPKAVLDLAVATSKASNAHYWACDVAVGRDGKYRILECATAFAAFPYIRDWIGQYIMWQLSAKQFKKPYIPLYNWQELGKIHSTLLRTMRHISFSLHDQSIAQDCHEQFTTTTRDGYPIMHTKTYQEEEWPSEIWNQQSDYLIHSLDKEVTPASKELKQRHISNAVMCEEGMVQEQGVLPTISENHLYQFFSEVKGIGNKLAKNIIDTLGCSGVTDALLNDPQKLMQVRYIKNKKLLNITRYWPTFYNTL